jgi:hypothetical protein
MAPPNHPTGLLHDIMFTQDESKIHMYFLFFLKYACDVFVANLLL